MQGVAYHPHGWRCDACTAPHERVPSCWWVPNPLLQTAQAAVERLQGTPAQPQRQQQQRGKLEDSNSDEDEAAPLSRRAAALGAPGGGGVGGKRKAAAVLEDSDSDSECAGGAEAAPKSVRIAGQPAAARRRMAVVVDSDSGGALWCSSSETLCSAGRLQPWGVTACVDARALSLHMPFDLSGRHPSPCSDDDADLVPLAAMPKLAPRPPLAPRSNNENAAANATPAARPPLKFKKMAGACGCVHALCVCVMCAGLAGLAGPSLMPPRHPLPHLPCARRSP